MGRTYRVGEVARRCAVSVRTLHHYHERGLLVPSARSESGYRLYTDGDLARLVEILSLRALGLRLERIGALLDRPGADAERAPRLRRMVIRRQLMDLAALDEAISEALARGAAAGDWMISMPAQVRSPRLTEQEMEDIVEQYYTAEQLSAFEQLAAETGAEEIAAVERAWAEIIPAVRAAREAGMDPASAEAQALGQRWRDLVERTFRGQTELRDAVGAAYQAGAFAADPALPNAEDFAFIAEVESRES